MQKPSQIDPRLHVMRVGREARGIGRAGSVSSIAKARA